VPPPFSSMNSTGGRFCPLAFAVSDTKATAVLVDKFDSSQFKGPFKRRKDRGARFCCLPLKYPNRSYPHPGSIREFLLRPIKETSGRSALRSCNHAVLYDQSW
jgi:hypothetical protein